MAAVGKGYLCRSDCLSSKPSEAVLEQQGVGGLARMKVMVADILERNGARATKRMEP